MREQAFSYKRETVSHVCVSCICIWHMTYACRRTGTLAGRWSTDAFSTIHCTVSDGRAAAVPSPTASSAATESRLRHCSITSRGRCKWREWWWRITPSQGWVRYSVQLVQAVAQVASAVVQMLMHRAPARALWFRTTHFITLRTNNVYTHTTNHHHSENCSSIWRGESWTADTYVTYVCVHTRIWEHTPPAHHEYM